MFLAFQSLKHDGDFGLGPLANHTRLTSIYVLYSSSLYLLCGHGEGIVRSLTMSPTGLIWAAAPS